ncbi:MAG: dihydroneopterin aldolase [Chloroflexota bacterium]
MDKARRSRKSPDFREKSGRRALKSAPMDKVFIKELRVRGILGIHDWERVTPREIVVSVTLFTDTREAARNDGIADCADYSATAKKIRAHAESAARMTIEALANDIARLCLEDAKVRKVLVRVEKPGAVAESASVGVEIERTRPAGVKKEARKSRRGRVGSRSK